MMARVATQHLQITTSVLLETSLQDFLSFGADAILGLLNE